MGTSCVGVAKRTRLCSCGISLANESSACCQIKSSSSSVSSSINNLTDDLLLDILLRFPPNFLHRCKSVSRRWHSLISAPCFARSYIRLYCHTTINFMLILKTESVRGIRQVYVLPLDRPRVSSSSPLTFDFIPSLCPNDFYYHRRAHPTSFEVVERVLMDMNSKATHGGLVLLEGDFRDNTCARPYYCNLSYFHYYVCNPVTKQYLELPFLSNPGSIGFACYYLQPPCTRVWADVASYSNILNQNPDFNPNKIDFTVVSVNVDEQADVFIIHVFSSADETPGWAIFHAPCPPDGGWFTKSGPIQVVFNNGKFHWLGCNGIAVYDPFNNPRECDIIPFPSMDSLKPEVKYYSFSLEAQQGHLRLVTSCKDTPRILIWEVVDYATKSWVQKIDIDFSVYGDFDDGNTLSYGGAVGDKIYMLDYPTTIMLFDVSNASLKYVDIKSIPLDSSLKLIQPFMSSPWPTPVPMSQRK